MANKGKDTNNSQFFEVHGQGRISRSLGKASTRYSVESSVV